MALGLLVSTAAGSAYADSTKLRVNLPRTQASELVSRIRTAGFRHGLETAHIRPSWIPEGENKTYVVTLNGNRSAIQGVIGELMPYQVR
jgi:hypothetical protein